MLSQTYTNRLCLSVLMGMLLASCGADSQQRASTDDVVKDGGSEATADVVTDAGEDSTPDVTSDTSTDGPAAKIEFAVYHSSDEHGWLQPFEKDGTIYGGVANFFARIKADGFAPKHDLLLSSGDNWTGPAISTLFQGKPVVQAFNYMGYSATAVGNHEFDFGVPVLTQRVSESAYAYLSANSRDRVTGEQVAFAVPYKIVPLQGIDIGLVGVTTTTTSFSAHPKNVKDIDFLPIADTLEAVVPKVRSEGAEVVFVLAHEAGFVMQNVAANMKVHVDAIFSGHDHQGGYTTVGGSMVLGGGTPVMGAGSFLRSYRRAKFNYDPASGITKLLDTSLESVSYASTGTNPVTPDQGLVDMVAQWQKKEDAQLGKTVGYTVTGINQGSWTEGNWVTDAWLSVYPDVDIAMTNYGGLRQAIAEGDIAVKDIYGVLPFDNSIYELALTGAQIIHDIQVSTKQCAPMNGCFLAVGGLTYTGIGSTVKVVLKNGQPIDAAATYRVLVNDYMYAAGPYPLKTQDTTPIDYGVNYRDPVVTWTTQQHSTKADPLENHIDAAPRNQ